MDFVDAKRNILCILALSQHNQVLTDFITLCMLLYDVCVWRGNDIDRQRERGHRLCDVISFRLIKVTSLHTNSCTHYTVGNFRCDHIYVHQISIWICNERIRNSLKRTFTLWQIYLSHSQATAGRTKTFNPMHFSSQLNFCLALQWISWAICVQCSRGFLLISYPHSRSLTF